LHFYYPISVNKNAKPRIADAKGVAQNTVSWRLQLHDEGGGNG